MMRKGIRLVQVITLVAAASMIVLKLQASILAQASEPIGDVPESRQAMGMNLSPYREGGVPIDEPIVSDLENLGVKWMRFEFRA
ncbi:MAG: hypothetical protein ACK2UA_19955, partial [Anaerolineae bacterium]